MIEKTNNHDSVEVDENLMEIVHKTVVAYTNQKAKMFENYIREKHKWYITQNIDTWLYEVRYIESDYLVSEIEVSSAYSVFNDNYPTPQKWIELVTKGEEIERI